MNKVRNAVIIIILCIIGAGIAKRKPKLSLVMPPSSELKDAVSGHRIAEPERDLPDEEYLPATQLFQRIPGKTSNTLGDISAPPRGQARGFIPALPPESRETPPLSPYKP